METQEERRNLNCNNYLNFSYLVSSSVLKSEEKLISHYLKSSLVLKSEEKKAYYNRYLNSSFLPSSSVLKSNKISLSQYSNFPVLKSEIKIHNHINCLRSKLKCH